MTPEDKVIIEVQTNVEMKATLRRALRSERWRLLCLLVLGGLALAGSIVAVLLLTAYALFGTVALRMTLLSWADTIKYWKESVGYVEEE